MSETFESLELAPWIVRQTGKLGKLHTVGHFLTWNFIKKLIFDRSKATHTNSNKLHSKNSIGFRLHWCCENRVYIGLNIEFNCYNF